MGRPTPKDWRGGRLAQTAKLIGVWTDMWRMGRGPGATQISEIVQRRYPHCFDSFGSLPLWQVEELAREEVSERSRRALAAFRDTVDRPSRRKAGEMC